MTWNEVLLARLPAFGDLARAVANAFDVSADQVSVVGPEWAGTTTAPILVVAQTTAGEFRGLIDISVDEPFGGVNELEGARIICRSLGLRGFVGDDSLDPSTGYLITGDGRVVRASLDDDAEERGEYRLRP